MTKLQGQAQNQTQSTTQNLKQLVDLKWQIEALTAKRKEIEPLAIEEALQVMSGLAKGSVVLETPSGKITFAKVKKAPSIEKPEGFPDLEHLVEVFQLEAEAILRDNKEEFKEIERKIQVLQGRIENLQKRREKKLSTPRMVQLKEEIEEEIAACTVMEPQLRVQLTK
ncbi:hypothetical protein K9N68_37615 (plasmid) [Kovacikia minuta CCNUW1]|uniref:hypothetical protein n=1 Tax=Kovacikia minuta TaxID=2931930 RepID=UPI001CCBA98A|nr:hypothetical protein [Kovacikia minuta]UBF29932.1 hypothetical protein K9N68_37615 [Kovacikia minuta CCNUW1]